MDKTSFRKQQLKRLQDFAVTPDKAIEDKQLTQQLLALPVLKSASTIAVTKALPFEVDTAGLIADLWRLGKQVFLAKARPDRQLDFLAYGPQTKLTISKFGVPEVAGPAAINNDCELVIVPGLAFAAQGHARLGFGGGYYDRYLRQHPNLQTVSLANSAMWYDQPAWPVEATDQPVKTILTTAHE
ncbi:MAG: 5-formyltetrahydrofolate cyclo-ligase [Lactobacillus sp.]|jgi:5-formyltetrahydrofolate cyclo-ligase|nr:5-formyltetrahydrofolate cyclo-ligase [Lactobacillus sp.]